MAKRKFKMKPDEKIIFDAIPFEGEIEFEDLMEKTGFSEDELRSHCWRMTGRFILRRGEYEGWKQRIYFSRFPQD